VDLVVLQAPQDQTVLQECLILPEQAVLLAQVVRPGLTVHQGNQLVLELQAQVDQMVLLD
jgi:hypothetical protein